MIDQSRLDELANDFGEEDLAEIIEVFLTETWEAIDALECKAGSMDEQEQREQFHFLKGCARNIGAEDFGNMCEVWENGPQSFAASDYPSLRSAFQAVCDELSGRGLRLSA
ncbi:MAG: Hpt domain-containing protein [Pseudomonadota bacterium]